MLIRQIEEVEHVKFYYVSVLMCVIDSTKSGQRISRKFQPLQKGSAIVLAGSMLFFLQCYSLGKSANIQKNLVCKIGAKTDQKRAG